jgi:hypothetical protein
MLPMTFGLDLCPVFVERWRIIAVELETQPWYNITPTGGQRTTQYQIVYKVTIFNA